MEFKDVIYTKENGIATITLNRPQVLNAYTPGMIGELVAAVERAKVDDSVRVLVITGAGRGFASGADLKALAIGQNLAPERIPRVLGTLEKPYIAAINGPAVGGGFDLASMADIRIASDKATFAMNHLRVAGLSDDGGYYFLSRILGVAKTVELVLTYRFFDAQEALRMGYVNKVVPHDELAKATGELAAQLAAGPPVAMRLAKHLVYESPYVSLEKHIEDAKLAWHFNNTTEDVREGRQAFAEKRPPVFKGK